MAQGLGVFRAEALQKCASSIGNVFATVAQRRQLQVDDVEAVIEIFAEAAFPDQREQIDVGGGDDAHVDLELFGAAEAHELALLNHAQELGLRLRADGGDFVEEDRSLIGDFEEAFFGGDGAGERAFHMAEELRFQKVDGNGAGVDGHEGAVGARGGGVNRFRDQFFSSAAFPADQHRGAGRRDLRDQVEQREHLFALADDVREIEALLQRPLELNVFLAQAMGLHGLRHLRQQFVVGPRLGDVVHRAALERGARHVDGAVGGDQHDGEIADRAGGCL